MKKILYLVMLVGAVTTSCIKSPEDKANVLIEEYVKTCLFNPDTYENVTTRLDSAFTPYCDPAFHKMLLSLNEIDNSIDECDNEIEQERRDAARAKSSMLLYSEGYTAHTHDLSQQYKEEYEEHIQKMQEHIEYKESLMKKGDELYKKIQAEISKKPQFIGFHAIHRYRANNNAGQALLNDVYFIFDKDFTQILSVYDMHNINELRTIEEMIKELKEDQE